MEKKLIIINTMLSLYLVPSVASRFYYSITSLVPLQIRHILDVIQSQVPLRETSDTSLESIVRDQKTAEGALG